MTFVFVSGMVIGSMYGLIGLGLALEYRISGVINFAHGAQAMLAAFVFVRLRPDIGLLPAFVAALVLSAVIGVGVEWLSVDRLRGADVVNQVIVTLGLLLVLQGAAGVIFGQEAQAAPSIFTGTHRVLGVSLARDQVLALGLGPVLGAALAAYLKFTPMGLRLRAAANRPEQAALVGLNVRLLSRTAWAIGAVLAAIAGIFLTPSLSLDPVLISLVVIAAYAALLVGGLEGLFLTILGGIALGVLQAAASYNMPWLIGVREIVSLAVAAGALLARSKRLAWT